jgi:hypothetical protein
MSTTTKNEVFEAKDVPERKQIDFFWNLINI